MKDDGSDEDAEELPPEEPASSLDRLDDGYEDIGTPDEHPSSAPRLSRREIDDLVNEVVTEALGKLGGEKKKP